MISTSEAHKFASESQRKIYQKTSDYYAMGHIHERSEWNFDFLGGPVKCIPGSIEVIEVTLGQWGCNSKKRLHGLLYKNFKMYKFLLGGNAVSHAMLQIGYHKLGYAVHVGEKPAYHAKSLTHDSRHR